MREIRARLDAASDALGDLAGLFGARLPFGASAPGGVVTIHCPEKAVFPLVEHLAKAGADDITVNAPAYVFRKANPLIERLQARI